MSDEAGPGPPAGGRKPHVMVVGHLLGRHLYGAERIVCGTDGSEFGCTWTRKALAEARITDEVREKILYGNAAALLSHLTPITQREKAAA